MSRETPPWLITAEELREELSNSSVSAGDAGPMLLDVREPEEWLESRLEGCVLIPLGELLERVEKELPSKDAKIVIYCAHGIRSMHALRAMQMKGYLKLRSLVGGICAWEELGGKVRSGSPE